MQSELKDMKETNAKPAAPGNIIAKDGSTFLVISADRQVMTSSGSVEAG